MGKKFRITVDGISHEVEVEEAGSTVSAVVTQSAPAPANVASPKAVREQPAVKVSADANSVVAPLQGTLQEIKVSVGQAVTKGQVLVIIEAMKMENEVVAPKDGTVSAIYLNKGTKVNSGDAILSLS